MPAYLKYEDEGDGALFVVLGKMSKAEFSDALAKVKNITGSRFDATTKRWYLPNTAESALRAMQMLDPTADAAVQELVRNHTAETATELVTNVGDDAELLVPWAAKLRPYQRSGVDFMVRNPHALLADEMGTGKTLQAIATAHEFRARTERDHGEPPQAKDILVICPKAVRGTWKRELEQGPLDADGEPVIADWPATETQVVDHRDAKKRLKQLQNPDAGAFVINWESFWRDPLYDEVRKRDWLMIVADEAHRAKNRGAKQSKGLRKLRAPLQIAATGTPIMNSPDELWALLAWLRPEQYTSFYAFENQYVNYYIGAHKEHIIIGVKNADALRFELADKMVRRRKVDVLKDLPPKMPPQIIEVELTPAQRKLYDEVEKALILDVAAHVQAEADAHVERCEAEDIAHDRAAWVQERTEELASMPLDRLVGLVDNAGARLAKLRQITAAAKVAVADELIREEPDTPVVAFTWHVPAAHQLAEALQAGQSRLRVGTIAGTIDADPVKDSFQAGDLDHVVCTIAKGGQGLTLTRSSNPLFVEEDWVPAINDQATDRTHRIGQTEPVTPRILRCPNTVDTKKIVPKLEFKRRVGEAVLGA